MLTAIRPVSDSFVTVRVPRDVRDRLIALAAARDHSLSQEARRAFWRYLAESENHSQPVELDSAA
jgi:predicted transcriptional regulator